MNIFSIPHSYISCRRRFALYLYELPHFSHEYRGKWNKQPVNIFDKKKYLNKITSSWMVDKKYNFQIYTSYHIDLYSKKDHPKTDRGNSILNLNKTDLIYLNNSKTKKLGTTISSDFFYKISLTITNKLILQFDHFKLYNYNTIISTFDKQNILIFMHGYSYVLITNNFSMKIIKIPKYLIKFIKQNNMKALAVVLKNNN
ncbi:hypothetical protein AGLY_008096 [Aphis glycines]|uniref:Uncharacterized protein n=1 Tax=Aphis glycines TaxID=307491 RepID=A0A6G0TLQ7_APHGL|nr:hypothetical protein AGLY_008096 [Aphis glycines]